ncbi:hypothetical protein Y032_0021g303 [Ancylostoma ceylanicum]|uniref:Uncharacterized protein n=1 Tax=Ancylostoma ceylanicum TaxID=53326 RepID=A0A016UYY2_9BILA|nr:hypothetical protein Y032_0021g303 [Ancylostoma ceylanicum]
MFLLGDSDQGVRLSNVDRVRAANREETRPSRSQDSFEKEKEPPEQRTPLFPCRKRQNETPRQTELGDDYGLFYRRAGRRHAEGNGEQGRDVGQNTESRTYKCHGELRTSID